VFANGPKYREPNSINWKHNFEILMDSVKDYARQWVIQQEHKTDLCLSRISSFASVVGVYIGLPGEL
jgi:hypothetical protein